MRKNYEGGKNEKDVDCVDGTDRHGSGICDG